MSVAVAYPFAVAAAAEDAAIVAGGIPLAFVALAWYAYYAVHHDPQWSQSGGSGGDSTPAPPPSDPPPVPPGREDPIAAVHDYAGLAYPVRGLVGLDTHLGVGRHPVPCAIPEHAMSIPRRAMRMQGPRGPPDSPARRITRSMSRAAKRAGELMETPRVKRTMQGIYHHTSVHYDPPTTRSRARVSIRHHPYRAAAHALGFGHLAHLIP